MKLGTGEGRDRLDRFYSYFTADELVQEHAEAEAERREAVHMLRQTDELIAAIVEEVRRMRLSPCWV